jgi:Polysaccharide pyruvyl transferase
LKIAAFKYDLSDNVGDNIQTLAVTQHLKQVDLYIDRDSLSSYRGDECVIVMNGWFSHRVENWPPSDAIHPIFFGFHMTAEAAGAYKKYASYFKEHEPIGCRDEGTALMLREWGVDAYRSGCATLTFPKRKTAPAAGVNILVDCSKRLFKREDRKGLETVSHTIANVDYAAKNNYAAALLDFYRTRAKSVVTSRIHCAMPCVAMGIPVVYIGVEEYRTDVMKIAGIEYTQEKKFGKLNFDKLNFFKEDIEELKATLKNDLKSKLSRYNIILEE